MHQFFRLGASFAILTKKKRWVLHRRAEEGQKKSALLTAVDFANPVVQHSVVVVLSLWSSSVFMLIRIPTIGSQCKQDRETC